MKSEEESCLWKGKRKEGKGDEQIDYEIETLKFSQVEFKQLEKEIRQLNRIIKSRDKQIRKLQGMKKEERIKDFTKKFEDDIKRTTNKDFTNRYLRRIMNHLEHDKEYTCSDIRDQLMIAPDVAKNCMKLLIDMDKATYRVDNGNVVRYKLK